MRRFFARDGILLRSILVTGLAFVLVGITTVLYTMVETRRIVEEQSRVRLEQLLDTVQSTLRVACFVKDQGLAREVAVGLLNNTVVLSVTIREGEQVLADVRRDGARASADPSIPPGTLLRSITSPFVDGEVIGQIQMAPDPQVIDEHIHREIIHRTIQLAWQLALIAGVMVLTLLAFVIHPISAISRNLHDMDPTHGDRLPVPVGHADTEIGRLVADVNTLAERLVLALEKEHGLRLQREVDERKYHAIFDNAGSGIFIVDRHGRISSWNSAMARLLGIPPADAFTDDLLLGAIPWDDPEEIERLFAHVFASNTSATLDIPVRRPDNSLFWLNVALSPIGEDILQGVAHDVSGLKEAEAQARRLAVTDPLTGLANRAGLEHQLQQQINQALRHPESGFTLLHIDLDKFRQITEGIGVPAGDEILRSVAGRLSSTVKHNDILARLGADIFLVILPKILHDETIDKIIERIMASLGQPYLIDGSPIQLTASVGIALFPNDGSDAPSLLRHAELAADKAKACGGNQAVFFDPTLAISAEQRRHMENDLRQACREQQFVLYYQAIFDLQANRLAGAEALIRWRHPERGLVPPDHFIPVVEQSGLINEIGLWVVDAACAQLASWQRDGRAYTLSVNVSGRQIPGGLPPSSIEEALRRHDVLPERLALEITEGVLLGNIAEAQAWLQAVQKLGVRVYLDDFGTGYSSLSYLKRFPLDTLKIDRAFVQDMLPGNSEHSLVQAIIAMARSLDLKVVAEGVESATHLQMLQEMGCHFAQGYYLSRPVPANDFFLAVEQIESLVAGQFNRAIEQM